KSLALQKLLEKCTCKNRNCNEKIGKTNKLTTNHVIRFSAACEVGFLAGSVIGGHPLFDPLGYEISAHGWAASHTGVTPIIFEVHGYALLPREVQIYSYWSARSCTP
ncbi:hypothetical protein, partial [Salmonella sp. s60732]|uniref:hypothetical protein n=1 Tax=Salmonella sp. s60732 TaxID=3160132 RepID=UPI003754D5FF